MGSLLKKEKGDVSVNGEFEKLLDALLNSPKIRMTNQDIIRCSPKTEGVYVIWLGDLCLKVGQCGERLSEPEDRRGLHGRLTLHRRQHTGNSTFAEQMERDVDFGRKHGYDFKDRKHRTRFVEEQCHCQVLSLKGSNLKMRRKFEKFIEFRLNPRYIGTRRWMKKRD